MRENEQDIKRKIKASKRTIKQLEAQIKRDDKEYQKAKEKLIKQIEREKEKEQNSQANKIRNKKIFAWGKLIPLVLDKEGFDNIADNDEVKEAFIGVLIKIKQELNANSKQNWLKFYRNHGKKFLDNVNNGRLNPSQELSKNEKQDGDPTNNLFPLL